MSVISEYVSQTADIILKMYPDLDKNDVDETIRSIIRERIKDPSINIDNNVTGDNRDITLTSLCNWIDKAKPVISGNATFYQQPSTLKSPTSNMLKNMKRGRKQVKGAMFKLVPGSDEYQQSDLKQQNLKVVMNAEYGGSGTPTAAFYTKYSPAATTLMAQSIITTMAAFFESYVGGNQKFYNINECWDWLKKIERKKDPVPKWVHIPSSRDILYELSSHFIILNMDDVSILRRYIDSCTHDEKAYIYYANNMKAFIRNHSEVQSLIRSVLTDLPNYEAVEHDIPAEFTDRFSNVNDYNKWVSSVMFLNPYKPPEAISDTLIKLSTIMKQFVFVEYITPDSIVKLNNHKRNTVLLVDTDSNMINADIFVSFVQDVIFPGETFGRPRLYNDMILVNTLAACLDKCVASLLDYYGRCHNMDEESRAELTMKNEFMFRRFFLMKTKKRYAASIVLREGNIMMPFKDEIKGMDFIKAAVSEKVEKRFKSMICDHILFSEELELHDLMKDVKMFEKEIYEDLKHGSTTYLKSVMLKSDNAYSKDKIWSLQVYRGSAIWNIMYPSQKIYALDRVSILKLIVTGPADLEVIKDDYPEEYTKAMTQIFGSNDMNIRNSGLKIIAIPASVKQIPDWLIPLIDYDAIVSDTIASFRSVLDALDIEDMNFKTPNNKANITSCLISI